MFELKVMEPAAFKFDDIATQAGQSSAGMPEKGCRTRRREEGGSRILFKEAHESDQCCVAAPRKHYTLHYTQHYTQHYRTAGRGSILEL